MDFILTIIVTLLIAPVALWIITRLSQNKYKFPSKVTGLIGDTIFLPLFNALAVYYGLFNNLLNNQIMLWISILTTMLFSFSYFTYRKKARISGGWMYTKDKEFNFAGWYHFIYVILQSFVIFTSLLYFYNFVWIWVVLVGYILTVRHSKKILS